MSGGQSAKLVDHEGDHIGKSALIADGKPGPFHVVHLTPDRADRGKAGGAEQVEHQEGICGNRSKGTCQCLVDCPFSAPVQDAHGTYDVLFCHETGDGGDGRLPVSPAQGGKDPGDGAADTGEDRHIQLILFQHPEGSVHKTEVAQEPYDNSGKKDNRSRFLDKGPAALPHGTEHVDGRRHMVSRELHDKGSGVAREHGCLFEHDTGDDDSGHTDEIGGGCHPGGSVEDRAGDHRDEGHLGAAGDEGGGHDRHPAVTFVFNSSRCHDTGDTAAGSDEHGNEGFTGKAEFPENTVKDEGDTGHIAAGLQEGQHQEQDQHLGHETEDSADACDDTVKDQGFQDTGNTQLVEDSFDHDRNTGDPGAIGSGIGSLALVLLINFHGTAQFLCRVGHILRGERLFIFKSVLCLSACRYSGSCCADTVHINAAVFICIISDAHESIHNIKGVSEFLRVCLVGLRSVSKQVPSVSEKTIIGPVRGRSADTDHSDPVDKEHDCRKDRQAEPAVGHDLVDLVRSRELTDSVLFIASIDQFRNINVALISDDTLGVIIQFCLGSHDILFHMGKGIRIDLKVFHDLLISLEDLDGIPALLLLRHIVDDRFLDMSDGVFHRSGKSMLRDSFILFGRFDGRLCGIHDTDSLQSGNLHDSASQLPGQLPEIDLIPVFLYEVAHIDRHDDRDSEFHKLCRQIQISLQVRSVNNVENGIGPLLDEIVSGNYLLQGIGRQRIDTRKIRDDHAVMLL